LFSIFKGGLQNAVKQEVIVASAHKVKQQGCCWNQ